MISVHISSHHCFITWKFAENVTALVAIPHQKLARFTQCIIYCKSKSYNEKIAFIVLFIGCNFAIAWIVVFEIPLLNTRKNARVTFIFKEKQSFLLSYLHDTFGVVMLFNGNKIMSFLWVRMRLWNANVTRRNILSSKR